MRNDEVIKQFIQLNRATEGSCAFHCALCLSSKEIEVKQKFSLCRKEMRTHAYGSKNKGLEMMRDTRFCLPTTQNGEFC